MAPLVSSLSDLLVEFILLIPENSTSAGLEAPALMRWATELPAGELVEVLLSLKLRLPTNLVRLPIMMYHTGPD